MNTSVVPVINFRVENPGSSLLLSTSAWTSPTTFVATYNVNDLNADIPNIDVRISSGKDTGGNTFGSFTKVDLVSIDTANPIVIAITLNDPSLTKLPTVSWTVTFSDTVTGVGIGNFTLFNGGLTGNPAITSVTGSGSSWTVSASTGSGEGNLGLYAVNAGVVVDIHNNSLAALPVAGPAYAIDHVSPAIAQLITNVSTI